jgi:hypothetical protein
MADIPRRLIRAGLVAPHNCLSGRSEDFLDDAYQQWLLHGSKALETMATSEPSKFCQMIAGLLPKEMHIQDESINIREIRHVIVEANDKAIEHDETPAIEHLGAADATRKRCN